MVMFRLLMTFLIPLGFRLFGARTQAAREWYRGSHTSSWNVVQGAFDGGRPAGELTSNL